MNKIVADKDVQINKIDRLDYPEVQTELKIFLDQWDKDYKRNATAIGLFDKSWVADWSSKQKSFFVKAFYHARGHFHDFLWYLGNHAPDKETKEIILHNIAEEFGGKARSHELCYADFAYYYGVDIYHEMITEETYCDFLRAFNKGHISWLLTHDWQDCMSAFSAYERLDNIDYVNLIDTAVAMGTPERSLLFFKIHTKVEHFDTTISALNKAWCENPKKVREAFNYIAEHQLTMWRNLSDEISKQ